MKEGGIPCYLLSNFQYHIQNYKHSCTWGAWLNFSLDFVYWTVVLALNCKQVHHFQIEIEMIHFFPFKDIVAYLTQKETESSRVR